MCRKSGFERKDLLLSPFFFRKFQQKSQFSPLGAPQNERQRSIESGDTYCFIENYLKRLTSGLTTSSLTKSITNTTLDAISHHSAPPAC